MMQYVRPTAKRVDALLFRAWGPYPVARLPVTDVPIAITRRHHPVQRSFSTRESRALSPVDIILQERAAASKASPLPLPPEAATKRRAPPRAATLYEALIRPDQGRPVKLRHNDDVACSINGEDIEREAQVAFRNQLSACIEEADASGALAVLDKIVNDSYVPTGRAIIMAIEAAVASGQLPLGEQALSHLETTFDHGVSRSARTVLAVAFSTRGAYIDALRVMQIENWESLAGSNYKAVEAQLDQLRLGRDTVAWGVIMKALTKLGSPQTAVTVVDVAMKQGVGMTDSLLHLTIDALRWAGKWKEAVWLFDRAIEKGMTPHERTLASTLLALTGRNARTQVDLKKVEEVVDMADNASGKFMSVALMALSSIGSLSRAEHLFFEIGQNAQDGTADETAFSCMMAAYYNYIERFTDEDELRREKIYEEISQKADVLWHAYMKRYRLQRPSGMTRGEREMMLSKFLRTKTRCFRTEDAVRTLEELTCRKDMYPWLDVRIFHVTAVLGAVELSSDIGLLERLLGVMHKAGLSHDMRSLAFTIGTVVSDGSLQRGLSLVRTEGTAVLEREKLQSTYRDYYPALLVRRLHLLANGFKDVGIGNVPDLDVLIRKVQDYRVDRAVDSRFQGGNDPRKRYMSQSPATSAASGNKS